MSTIITFLNDKGLKADAAYKWRGQTYPGGVFCLALREFVPHDRMLVCNTPEAEKITWPHIAALNDPRIEPVPIPKGESTDQMWDLFDKIAARIHEDETVVFDITHGLRSLPFLVFLFAAYLKSAKRVKIEAIYYGAYELADFKNGKPAPVIDLSEFVTMLDWLTATDQFVQTGDARRLARLLNPNQQTKGATARASQKLSEVSLAAFLCQPFTLLREAQTLDAALQAAQTELAKAAQPFDVVRRQIVTTFGAFGANFDPAQPAEGLRAQFRLIEWYYRNNQLIQAMTLAREWLISAVTYRLGEAIDLARAPRKEMEWAVSGLPKVGGPHPDRPATFDIADLNSWGQTICTTWSEDERETLKKSWAALEVVRNGLDHAEHQKGALPLKTIENKAQKDVMPPLRALAQQWGLA